MRVALFGSILERDVVDDLHHALEAEGAEVFATGPVWAGHKLPPISPVPEAISAAIDAVNAFDPDLIFVFRQSALRPALIKKLRAPGRRIFVWLPDDPVLYRVYAQTIDHYDLSLHCGGPKVLQFYDRKGHAPGLRFPFWADEDRLPYHGPKADGPASAAFFGLLTGRFKSHRAETLLRLLPSFPGGITVYGRGDLPEGLTDGGYLDGPDAMATALSRHHVMLNLPQRFADYNDTRWAQPEFKRLGHFDIPSRLVQMAALGLPTITIAPDNRLFARAKQHDSLPHLIVPGPGRALRREVDRLRDAGTAMTAGQDLRRAFESNFTARGRARFLLSLAANSWQDQSVSARTLAYSDWSDGES